MKSTIKKIIWLSLIVTLMSTYIVILGETIAIAASVVIREDGTNIDNVKFDVYLNSNSTNVQEEQTLIVDVKVENKGVLRDAKISIENPNFKIRSEKVQNDYIEQINGNEIKLNAIVYSNDVKIELPIVFNKEEEFDEDYFEKEVSVKLEGLYEDKTVENLSTEKKVKIDWSSDSNINLTQDIDKYIDLGENKVLVQQDIYTEVTEGILPRKNEVVTVKVPEIDGKYPVEVKAIIEGVKVEELKYNNKNGMLEIVNKKVVDINNKVKWERSINEYNLIYIYENIESVGPKVFSLETRINSTLYGKAEQVEVSEQKEVESAQKGNIVEVQNEATSELYKGYMYANFVNETIYDETETVKISKADVTQEIELTDSSIAFLDERDRKYDISAGILYKSTTVNKDELKRIFGEEYLIKILDDKNNLVAIITNNSESDEKGNVTINYEEEVRNVRIETSKPQSEGSFNVKNVKAIKGEINYSKEQLKNFNRLLLNYTIKEKGKDETYTDKTEIVLNDTVTDATMEISNTNLSTLQTNKDVEFLVTLTSNSEKYDLYKNPVVEIVLPKELNINVKTTEQLNFGEEVNVTKIGMREQEDGMKIIRIEMQGEQVNFANGLTKGIQIVLIGDITIDDKIPSKGENIQLRYINENSGNIEQVYNVPIMMKSKDGVLMTSSIENYSKSGEVLEAKDDKFINAILDAKSEARLVTEEINVINNYEEPISNVSIIGKIGNTEEINGEAFVTTIQANLQDIAAKQNKNISVYYTDNSDLEKESEEWKSTTEELETVKAFKVIVEDEILPQEVFTLNYKLALPGDIGEGESLYTKTSLGYDYQENRSNTVSVVDLSTEGTKAVIQELDGGIEKDIDDIKVKVVGRTGDTYLTGKETLREGQGIKYIIQVTNNSNKDMQNVVLEATNTNAIYYNQIEYDEDVFGEIMRKIKTDEDTELDKKILEVGTLNAGETKEVSYQISVDQIDESTTLSGEIQVKVNDEIKGTVENYTNKIEDGKLKLKLEYARNPVKEPKDPSENLLYSKENFELLLSVENISNDTIQNVKIELPVSDKVKFDRERVTKIDDNWKIDSDNIDYKDGVASIIIPNLNAGAKEKISVLMPINSMPTSELETQVREYFTVTSDNVTYVSNEIEQTITQIETDIKAVQTTNIEGDTAYDGDDIQFTIELENFGVIEKAISFNDLFENGLEVNNAKVIKGEEEKECEIYENNVSGILMLAGGEKAKIVIDTKLHVGWTSKERLSNSIIFNGTIVDIKANTVEFNIARRKNSNNPSTNNPNNPSNPGTSTTKNSISGIAWIDENKNGTRESTEAKLSKISVFLIDEQNQSIAKDSKGKQISTTTSSNGSYQFTNLENGKYSVAFVYDTKKYAITEYQKQGVLETVNSDVVSNTINVDNNEIKCAKTKELEVKDNKLENIDAGFIQANKFDLKLDKYVSRITINTNAGTQVNNYNKSKLAKAEIHAKQIANSTVTIEYVIEITNEGDVPGYASEIVDYMPNDLTFNQVQNPVWQKNKDGNLYTTALQNQVINPGETRNVSLILTKKMTQDNTGTTLNKAEISKQYNEYTLDDTDSIPANKNEKEDDMSGADVIISIKTGLIIYITLAVSTVLILGTGIYLIKKKVMVD